MTSRQQFCEAKMRSGKPFQEINALGICFAIACRISLPAFLLRKIARGALAQLVEHLLCKQRVSGSKPLSSTIFNTQKVLSDCFGFHGRYLTSYKEGSSAQRLCADLIWQRLYRQGWALNSKDIVWQLMSVRFVHKTSMDILFLAHGRQTLTVMHPNFWSGV